MLLGCGAYEGRRERRDGRRCVVEGALITCPGI
jgi:hypothetical protein